MEPTDLLVAFATKYATYILAAFVLSEALALIPSVKENSVFELITKFVKGLKDLIVKPVTPADAPGGKTSSSYKE